MAPMRFRHSCNSCEAVLRRQTKTRGSTAHAFTPSRNNLNTSLCERFSVQFIRKLSAVLSNAKKLFLPLALGACCT
jgi:hypothetical protein